MNNWVWPVAAYLGQGLLITLWISLLTVVLATILGLVIAALSQSTLTFARLIGRFYVDVFRGVPSLMILLFVFFALPQIGLRPGHSRPPSSDWGFGAGRTSVRSFAVPRVPFHTAKSRALERLA
ncbi:ABC transporter permease subunit [Bradyrhizobium cenepequi]